MSDPTRYGIAAGDRDEDQVEEHNTHTAASDLTAAEQLQNDADFRDHQAREFAKSEAVRDSGLAAALHQQDPDLSYRLDDPSLLKYPQPRAAELGQALYYLVQDQTANSDEIKELQQREGRPAWATAGRIEDEGLYRVLAWRAAQPVADHLVKTLYGIPERVTSCEPEDDQARYIASHFTQELTKALASRDAGPDHSQNAEKAGEILLAAVDYSNAVPPETHQQRLSQLLAALGGRSEAPAAESGIKETAWEVAYSRLRFEHVLGRRPESDINPMAHTNAKCAIVAAAAEYIADESRTPPNHPAAIQEKVNHWSAGLEAAGPQWEQAIDRFLGQSQIELLLNHSTELPAASDPTNYRNPALVPAVQYLTNVLEDSSDAIQDWLRSQEALTMSVQQQVRDPKYQRLQLEIHQIGFAIRALYHADQAATM